jgi:hypothetical protein
MNQNLQSAVWSVVKPLIGLRFQRKLKMHLIRNDLCKLAEFYGSDKWGLHRYAQHYQNHFSRFQFKTFNLLEIGVGGHEDPNSGGASLRMWKSFFPKANIFAVDIFDKKPQEEDRIKIFKGSQADGDFLRWIVAKIGGIDIVIDDGSHLNEHVALSFDALFPMLSVDGIYAIEDLQTSYWSEFGGSEDPLAPGTSIARLKAMIDGLNWEEFRSLRASGPFDQIISGMHFYHNLCFINKGPNTEGSNKNVRQVVEA